MASVSLMFGSLAHFYEKPVVVIATACAGSLAVLYGKHCKTKGELSFNHKYIPFISKLVFPN